MGLGLECSTVFRLSGSIGFRVREVVLGCKHGAGFRLSGASVFSVSGLEFRVSGLGFRV